MHTLVCFEGTSYAGKTSVAKMVEEKIGVLYGPRVASKYVKVEAETHKNPDHFARFTFFMKEIRARSEEIRQILMEESVLLDRYLLSVLASHNVLVGRRLEEESTISGIHQPDITFLLTVDEMALRKRMLTRPPRHQYESDPMFLLLVQKEFLRLADKSATVIIDTSVRTAEETTRIVAEKLGECGLTTSRSTIKEEI